MVYMSIKKPPKKYGRAQTKRLNPPGTVVPPKLTGKSGTTKTIKVKQNSCLKPEGNDRIAKPISHGRLSHSWRQWCKSALGIIVHFREELHTISQVVLLILEFWLRL